MCHLSVSSYLGQVNPNVAMQNIQNAYFVTELGIIIPEIVAAHHLFLFGINWSNLEFINLITRRPKSRDCAALCVC